MVEELQAPFDALSSTLFEVEQALGLEHSPAASQLQKHLTGLPGTVPTRIPSAAAADPIAVSSSKPQAASQQPNTESVTQSDAESDSSRAGARSGGQHEPVAKPTAGAAAEPQLQLHNNDARRASSKWNGVKAAPGDKASVVSSRKATPGHASPSFATAKGAAAIRECPLILQHPEGSDSLKCFNLPARHYASDPHQDVRDTLAQLLQEAALRPLKKENRRAHRRRSERCMSKKGKGSSEERGRPAQAQEAGRGRKRSWAEAEHEGPVAMDVDSPRPQPAGQHAAEPVVQDSGQGTGTAVAAGASEGVDSPSVGRSDARPSLGGGRLKPHQPGRRHANGLGSQQNAAAAARLTAAAVCKDGRVAPAPVQQASAGSGKAQALPARGEVEEGRSSTAAAAGQNTAQQQPQATVSPRVRTGLPDLGSPRSAGLPTPGSPLGRRTAAAQVPSTAATMQDNPLVKASYKSQGRIGVKHLRGKPTGAGLTPAPVKTKANSPAASGAGPQPQQRQPALPADTAAAAAVHEAAVQGSSEGWVEVEIDITGDGAQARSGGSSHSRAERSQSSSAQGAIPHQRRRPGSSAGTSRLRQQAAANSFLRQSVGVKPEPHQHQRHQGPLHPSVGSKRPREGSAAQPIDLDSDSLGSDSAATSGNSPAARKRSKLCVPRPVASPPAEEAEAVPAWEDSEDDVIILDNPPPAAAAPATSGVQQQPQPKQGEGATRARRGGPLGSVPPTASLFSETPASGMPGGQAAGSAAERPVTVDDDSEEEGSLEPPAGVPGAVQEMQRRDGRDEVALAAEWEQRQAVIKQQAQEAQREKARRRAEKEMNARTQARLDQHRQQLADREAVEQQKEQLRARVRADLQMRLRGLRTLPQVLRALGMKVEGGMWPSPAQQEKAYKLAQRQLHPDRHASAPISEQIMAEESFKAISSCFAKQNKR